MNISLDLLERKVLPNRQEEVRIVFNQTAKDIPTSEGEGDIVSDESLFKPLAKRSVVSILDKRKQSTLDRNVILKRLQEHKRLTTRNDTMKSTDAVVAFEEETKKEVSAQALLQVPIPTQRKLVIRKSEGQGEGAEADEDQDQDYKDLLAMVKKPRQEGEVLEEQEQELGKEQELELGKELGSVPIKIKIKRPRKQPEAKEEENKEIDLTTAVIRTQKVADRLPKEREKVIIKASEYYMNNRKLFIQKLTSMFNPYSRDILADSTTASCDSRSQSADFDLLTHQKIVRDYLNLYTPYRGLLLYHGLGSGKTCTSIAIAEGMKSNKRVYVLTPASLKMNFFSEMKKCGDLLYKKDQFWEFVSIEGNPEYVGVLSKALSLSTEYIRKHGGAWLVNIKKKANYTELSSVEQTTLDKQLDEMIRTKYTDINYNGLNRRKIDALTGSGSRNPFDNSVVIIDEAHNLVSRIVNKITKPDSISYILYDCLMKAVNAKIVLLTGTPIINYPNEIGILYNILRGYIKTWTMTVTVGTSETINTDTIITMLANAGLRTYDFIEYTGNVLTITRNPFGFINVKKGERRAQGLVPAKALAPVQALAKEEVPVQALAKEEKVAKAPTKLTLKIKKPAQEKKGGNKTKRSRESLPFFNRLVEKFMAPEEYIDEEEDVAYKNSRIGQNFDNNPYKGGAATTKKSTGGAAEAFERYAGVALDETGNMTDQTFITTVLRILRENKLVVPPGTVDVNYYKALPDNSETFFASFVNSDTGEAQNLNLFQRRILGLTSYFRSAQEQLLPSYVKTSAGDIYHVVRSPMSNHQFGIYAKIRKEEADREKSNKKRKLKQTAEDPYTISSTYRIFSRAACNFTFPNEIQRPVPVVKENEDLSEATFDVVPLRERVEVDEFGGMGEEEEAKEAEEEMADAEVTSYIKRIEKAMTDVSVMEEGTTTSKYLSLDALETLSPKFASIMENLLNEENEGLHLLYSHFRTIEGIGILKLILQANGFAEFKLTNTAAEGKQGWQIIEAEEDAGKPKFALYTGTETAEEKEIIRNVFNGAWDFVPTAIASKLRETSTNNMYGEAIKLLMITSSGAEGINLKNTRFVHIVEPYWHMVRIEQVVGRARRICSHQELPEALRTVKVFLYITTLSEEQKADDDNNKELLRRDISRVDKKTPVTTDETLYEMASLKQRINNQILQAVKESAVDCNLYTSTRSGDEPLVCYGFGKVSSNAFASHPIFEKDRDAVVEGLDVKTVKMRAVRIKIGDENYALNETTMEVYDLESYNRAKVSGTEPILVGRLENDRGQYRLVKL